MSKGRRAFTLIEALVTLIILAILLSGLFNISNTFGSAQGAVIDQGSADIDASREIDDLSDHLKNAQVCTNPFGVMNSVIETANASSFTYYINAAGRTVRYALAGTDLKRTDAAGTKVVMRNVSSVQCSYSKLPMYYGTPVPTAIPTQPSLAELPWLAAVKITVQVSKNGYVASYNTTIRLRNSPVKQTIRG